MPVFRDRQSYYTALKTTQAVHKELAKLVELKVIKPAGEGAFGYGQVYVALSRCRSLEDIYLIKPINIRDVKCDPVVKRFYAALNVR